MLKRNAAIFGACGLILSTLTAASHPTDPYAVYVTSVSAQTPVSAATNVDVEYILVIWLTSAGHYEYTVDVGSLTFSGTTCYQLGSISLSDIMEDVADHAVVKAVSAGYPGCGSTYFNKPTKVWAVECATRTGTGCSTAFSACSETDWAFQAYNIACPGNSNPATVTQTYTGTSGCECGEGTCPEGGLE